MTIIIDAIKHPSAMLEERSSAKPRLAVIIVGDDPASHVYVNSKSKMAYECGVKSVQHTLPVETT